MLPTPITPQLIIFFTIMSTNTVTVDSASIAAFAQVMTQAMDVMKVDLTNKLDKQSTELHAALKTGIETAVAPLVTRQDDFEKESQTRLSNLERQISMLIDRTAPPSLNSRSQAWPTLSHQPNVPTPCPSAPLPHPTHPAPQSSAPTPRSEPSPAQIMIQKIISRARTIIGVSPVTPDYTDRMAANSGDEKLFLVALEFLRVELGVKEHEIPDGDIIRVFTPHRVTDFKHIYIQFSNQTHASFCHFLGRTALKGKQSRVFNYIPKQLFNRWKTLDNEAFKLRDEQKLKTEINFTEYDMELLACPKGQYNFTKVAVDNLPPIDLPPPRSPPQGRTAPAPKRHRSPSSSPSLPLNSKKDRKLSPNKSPKGAAGDTTNHAMESSKDEDIAADSDTEETPKTPDQPALDVLAKVIDSGIVSHVQVSSPKTGNLTFDFGQNLPENRRHSLN